MIPRNMALRSKFIASQSRRELDEEPPDRHTQGQCR
jgi:hypothetical protein